MHSYRPTMRMVLLSVAGALIWLLPAISALPGWICGISSIGLLAIAIVDLVRSRGNDIEIRCISPQPIRISVGQSAKLLLQAKSPLLSPGSSMVLDLPQGLILDEMQTTEESDKEGETVFNTSIQLSGEQRGSFKIQECICECFSGWGLWHTSHLVVMDISIQVFSNIKKQFRKMNPAFLNQDQHGSHHLRLLGKGREFEKLREYVRGDAIEDIHWKATAKRNKLVTKEFQMERTQEICTVIDHSRMSGRLQDDGQILLEGYLGAAAAFNAILARQGDRIGWISFAETITRLAKPRTGARQALAFQQAMHDIQPRQVSPDFHELVTTIRTQFRRRSLLLILTDLRDPVAAEQLLEQIPALTSQHKVTVVSAIDNAIHPVFSRRVESRPEVYEHIAAHLQWSELQGLQKRFQSAGASLLLSHADRFAADLMQAYLTIRKRQVL
ncbi:MAG: DUF58 domain-containing protein [Puniceicoccaceae bacterium]